MKFIKNLAALLLSDAFSKLVSFVVVAYLARVLGPAGLGAFAWAQSVALTLTTISNFGFNEYGILKVAPDRRREHIGSIVGRIVGFRTVLASATVVLFFAAAEWFSRDALQRDLLLWSSLLIVSVVLSSEWLYTAVEDQVIPGLIRIVSRSAYLVGCLVFVVEPSDVVPALLMFVGSEALLQLLLLFTARQRLAIRWRPTLSGWRETLRGVAPLALYTVSGAVLAQADVVLLGSLLPPEAVGLYAGAVRILWLVISVKYVVAQLLYPKIVQRQANSPEALADFLSSLHTYTVVAAAAAVALLSVFAAPIVTTVLGPAYGDSRWIFAALTFGLFGELCWIAVPYAVIASSQRAYSAIMIVIGAAKVAVVAGLALTGNVVLVAMGAAVVNLLLFVLCLVYLRRRVLLLDMWRMLFLPVAALVVGATMIVFLEADLAVTWGALLLGTGSILFISERKRWNQDSLRADLRTVVH